MNTTQPIIPSFPDINEFLCPKEKISFEQAIRAHISYLKNTDISYNIQYANKLCEYLCIFDQKKISQMNKDFSQLMSYLQNWKQKNHYNFSIQLCPRKKSYKKFNEKVQLFIQTYLNANSEDLKQKYSLSRIYDLIGVRLILIFGEKDTHSDIAMCYKILDAVNHFFSSKKGYLPMNAEPLIDLGFVQEEYPDVIIPTTSEAVIPVDLCGSVKDYYVEPKANSYQSLHVVFHSQYGMPIEIQIRTMATHTRVEYENAMHEKHDKYRYPNPISLDRANININGYQYIVNNDGNGKVLNYVVEDFIGIEDSVNPFNIIY